MKVWFLIGMFLICSLIGMTQEEVLFEDFRQGIEVKLLLVYDTTTHRGDYITQVKSGTKITLQEKHSGTILHNTYKTNSDWYRLFNIFSFIIKGDELLIFYNSRGTVFIDKYLLCENSIDKTGRFTIGRHAMMSYENGGGILSVVTEERLGDDIYFYVSASQQIVPRPLEGLYVLRKEKLYKVVFTEKDQITLSGTQRSTQLNQQEELLKEFTVLWKETGNNTIKDIRQDVCLQGYNYLAAYNNKLTINRPPDIYFFFMRDSKNRLSIVRYMMWSGEWIVSDYVEEEIVSEDTE